MSWSMNGTRSSASLHVIIIIIIIIIKTLSSSL